MDFGFSSGVGSVISGTVSTASGFVSSTGLVNTSIYYKGTPISDEELACKEIIDHLHTDNPAWGARQMSAQLKARGYHVGRRKARRYMNEMDIYPIYPKMNLSKRMQQAKVCPYLLRNAVIDKPNQARSIDITYIPIKRGFLYLTAVIDWHSRWADNIMIERWFRSFKYEEAYLTQYNNIKEARTAIGQYIRTYNFERHHSALDYQTDVKLRTALNSITKESTVLIVAQRVSTIMNADKILVLNEGNVVAEGTHRELLKTCDIYYDIASSQLTKEELE